MKYFNFLGIILIVKEIFMVEQLFMLPTKGYKYPKP